jgi:hypothetical protein
MLADQWRYGITVPLSSLSLAMDIPPVTDMQDSDHMIGVIYLVDDPVVPDPGAPGVAPGEFPATSGRGISASLRTAVAILS